MKNLILPVIIFISSFSIQAQTGSWSELGSGIAKKGEIEAVAVDDTGYVYAGGYFENSSGNTYVAKWNGTVWSELGGSNSLTALGNFKSNASIEYNIVQIVTDNSGNLYVGGDLSDVNGIQFISKWNGSKWSKVQTGNDTLPFNYTRSLAVDKSGNLYASGQYYYSSVNYSSSFVAKWNGSSWNTLGGFKTDSIINQIAVDNSGNVYAAGAFRNANGYYYVIKWNGSTWSELGTGANALKANGVINALALDNSGNLYAAGNFTDANGVYYTAKWNGTTWSELGTGANALNSDGLGVNGTVYALATDKSGNVYMGGAYMYSGTNIWQWNGTNWNQLGTGWNGLNGNANILAIAVDQSENVYAAGQFQDLNLYFEVEKWTATNVPTASLAPQQQSPIAVYPNPGHDQVSIQTPEAGQLTVYAISGQMITTRAVSTGNSYVDLSGLTTGMYTLLFTGQSNAYTPIKWVKE